MRTTLLLLLFCCTNVLIAQTAAEKDLKFLDSVTKENKTYDVKLVINGHNVFNAFTVRQKLENQFSFLKEKKNTAEDPELVFTVYINTQLVGEPKFSVRKVDINRPTEADLYIYKCVYSFEANIEVKQNNKPLYNVTVPGRELTHNAETKIYKDITRNTYPIDTHLQMFMNEYKQNFPYQDQLFLNEFYILFRDYTKGRQPK